MWSGWRLMLYFWLTATRTSPQHRNTLRLIKYKPILYSIESLNKFFCCSTEAVQLPHKTFQSKDLLQLWRTAGMQFTHIQTQKGENSPWNKHSQLNSVMKVKYKATSVKGTKYHPDFMSLQHCTIVKTDSKLTHFHESTTMTFCCIATDVAV